MSHLKLFPLSLVSFPTKIVPLHIFEERYKILISECINNKSEFGIVYQNNNSLADFGCSMKVLKVVKNYPDGRMDIISKGKNIFKLNSCSFDPILIFAVLPTLVCLANMLTENGSITVRYVYTIFSVEVIWEAIFLLRIKNR